MSFNFKNPKIQKHMLEGYFGLEKESLRVTPQGFVPVEMEVAGA